MVAGIKPNLTFDEYLEIERKAEFRSEYVYGFMIPMYAASRWHELIVGNVVGELRQQLKQRPCEVYPSNMRVFIPFAGNGRYPDASVVCGEPEFYEERPLDTLLNPVIIIEVLSTSTEAIDRGAKAEEYRSITSLQEYLLIAQNRCHVEHYQRQANNQWLLSESNDLAATIQLLSINSELALAEIYYRVKFSAPTLSLQPLENEPR